MLDFCFLCVTYHKDFNYFVAMIESFKKHNVSNIPLFVVLQDESLSNIIDRESSYVGGGRVLQTI